LNNSVFKKHGKEIRFLLYGKFQKNIFKIKLKYIIFFLIFTTFANQEILPFLNEEMIKNLVEKIRKWKDAKIEDLDAKFGGNKPNSYNLKNSIYIFEKKSKTLSRNKLTNKSDLNDGKNLFQLSNIFLVKGNYFKKI